MSGAWILGIYRANHPISVVKLQIEILSVTYNYRIHNKIALSIKVQLLINMGLNYFDMSAIDTANDSWNFIFVVEITPGFLLFLQVHFQLNPHGKCGVPKLVSPPLASSILCFFPTLCLHHYQLNADKIVQLKNEVSQQVLVVLHTIPCQFPFCLNGIVIQICIHILKQ